MLCGYRNTNFPVSPRFLLSSVLTPLVVMTGNDNMKKKKKISDNSPHHFMPVHVIEHTPNKTENKIYQKLTIKIYMKLRGEVAAVREEEEGVVVVVV